MPLNPFRKAVVLTLALVFAIALGRESRAQSTAAPAVAPGSSVQQQKGPTVVVPSTDQVPRLAGRSTLYCAGYIKFQRFTGVPEIVGALEEQEQHSFSDGDVVYLNQGSKQGVKEGDRFQIVRPRGAVKDVHRSKKGFLGIFVQEVGMLEVVNVKENTSAAQITFSCNSVMLGDLLTRVPLRESPPVRPEVSLDRFSDPTNKQRGRVMMARDGREMLTRNDVVYIDLGSEDKVAPGDYLTIYRPLGTGTVTRIDNEENARGRTSGFASDRFRGGGYSIQAQRAKESTAFTDGHGYYRFRPITTKEIKRDRPRMPRKIVGEMVIIDVQTRTATAVITRVASEVHTGDWVEIQ
ncbi:MAG TPA: FlgT C-terminal domain-containing protein [Pyrinomonadaceae bacterium]